MSASVYIPKPCHENWNNMSPQEQGRHCGVCSKVVKDYTAMSNEEILQSLKKESKTGDVCGRINMNQLTPVNKKQKIYFWMNGVLVRKTMMALMGFLGLSFMAKKAQAQVIMGKMPVKGRVSTDQETNHKKLNLVIKSSRGQGPLAGAMISFISGTTKKETFTTDAEGRISLDFNPEEILNKQMELSISADGFEYKTVRFELVKNVQTIEIKMEEAIMIMGEMMYIPEEPDTNTGIEGSDTTSVVPADTLKTTCEKGQVGEGSLKNQPMLFVEPFKTTIDCWGGRDFTLVKPVMDDDPAETDTVPVLTVETGTENKSADITNTGTKGSDYDVYPVPSRDHVTIRSKNESGNVFWIEVFDLTGRKIHTVLNIQQNYVLDITAYTAGTYLVNIHKNEAVETKKIVVQ